VAPGSSPRSVVMLRHMRPTVLRTIAWDDPVDGRSRVGP
jgi:hypothetical protein